MNRNRNYKRDLYKGIETQRLQYEKRINEYDKNPNKCVFCNKPLAYKARYNVCCSRSCSAKLNNKKRKNLNIVRIVAQKLRMRIFFAESNVQMNIKLNLDGYKI